jgi:hypothetical protein
LAHAGHRRRQVHAPLDLAEVIVRHSAQQRLDLLLLEEVNVRVAA